jgi:urea carboxylase-associated protein 2
MTTDPQIIIAENRARYEALKREGQAHAPRALPGPSPRPAPALPDQAVIHRETIPGGWYWTTPLNPGEALRLVNVSGTSAVSLVAWHRNDPSERLNYADTIKVQWTAALGKGRVLLSDMGRAMLSIVEDSCGRHDALLGGSTASSNIERYGPGPWRNTRDNCLALALKLGLSRRDLPPSISFFAPVTTDARGRFLWSEGARAAGDFVDLRAEMALTVGLSNCPHPLDPASDYAPGPIEAIRFRAPPAAADDLCRTATAEATRAFQNTAAMAL